MALRRRRTRRSNALGIRRPIDKVLFGINAVVPGGTTPNFLLYTCSYPGTVTGLRWNLNCTAMVGIEGMISWVIMVVRESVAVPTTLVYAGAPATLVAPESNVLAYGQFGAPTVAAEALCPWPCIGETKTQRRMMAGDRLFLITSSLVSPGQILGIVQYFVKS